MFQTLMACHGRALCLFFIVMGFASAPVTGQTLDRCPVPEITEIRNVTVNTADIFWMASDSALTVDLEWRETGQADWNTIADIQTPVMLEGLTGCVTYEVRLIAHCNGLDSEASRIDTFEADGCCRIPTGLRLVNTSDFQAVVSWDSVSFSFEYPVRYREEGSDVWQELDVTTNIAGLQELTPCTRYEVQVGSRCDLETTDFSESLLFQTTDCGLCTDANWCTASAVDASAEWIDSVAFGAIRFQSGSNNGYLLRNTVETGLERQRPYVFHVRPGSFFQDSRYYLRMWIDLNQDEVFTDSTELLADPISPVDNSGWTQTITIPDTVQLGNTRMRIALKVILGQDTIRPSSCGDFLFGEVEDYCIAIDDLCPEVVPVLGMVDEESATISGERVTEAITFLYRYRKVSDMDFGEIEIAEDSISLSGLEECTDYLIEVLSVCIQDTSSWQQFFFKTACPNATRELLPVGTDLRVYPNPFSDHLTVAMRPLVTGPAVARLIGLVGKEIAHHEITLRNNDEVRIDFSGLGGLPHGMYVLVLESADRRQIVKLVK